MKSSRFDFIRRTKTLAPLTLLALASAWSPAAYAQAMLPPADPGACSVAPGDFAGWFDSGRVTPNGSVKAADGTKFPSMVNCDFYKWSEQMFLWVTSPPPKLYGGNSKWVFDSKAFYSVSTADSSGNRTMTQLGSGGPEQFAVRTAQVGADGLPVVVDAKGRLREVVEAPVAKDGNAELSGAQGKPVEVARIAVEKNGTADFFDAKGVAIKAKPAATTAMLTETALERSGRTAPEQAELVRELPSEDALEEFRSAKGAPTFVDLKDGRVDAVGVAQAGDSGVLVAQNGSLVYYETIVNNIYAYYLTGRKTGAIPPAWPASNPKTDPGQYPTTTADLKQVSDFYYKYNRMPLLSPQALAVELKLSWVEATNLPDDPSTYLITTAQVPEFKPSADNKTWTPTGKIKTTRLALVGIHVVGSVQHDPEMIWATFEHKRNAPFGNYSYFQKGATTPTAVPMNTSGKWLLTAAGSAGPFNTQHAAYCDDHDPDPVLCAQPGAYIQANTGYTITPSDTLLLDSWGANANTAPNGEVKSAAQSNTQVIAINNSVIGQLLGGDARGNYVMIGATWTKGGQAPSGSFSYPPPPAPAPNQGNEVGTSLLINTTMETYQQAGSEGNLYGTNCMSCHNAKKGPIANTILSHVFAGIAPLKLPPSK